MARKKNKGDLTDADWQPSNGESDQKPDESVSTFSITVSDSSEKRSPSTTESSESTAKPIPDEATFDLVLNSPQASETPDLASMHLPDTSRTGEVDLTPLDDRLRRLEVTLQRLQQLQGIEQQVVETLATHVQSAPTSSMPHQSSAKPSSSNLISAAAALVDAGRQLMPAITPSGPAQAISSAPRTYSPSDSYTLGGIIAEIQAMVYMYVDPRYRLSWVGRFLIPAVALSFLLSSFWVSYILCGLGALVSKPIELGLCYLLIKLLGYESQRYRQTAPDLPAGLRL